MDLQIYNPSLECTGIVDFFDSLIWHRKFFQPGVFELYAPATAGNLELLKKYSLIVKPNALEVGYINSIVIEDKDDEGEMITATGSFLSGLLSQRVILGGSGTLADIVNKNCITAAPERIIPNLVIGDCENITFGNDCYGKNLGAVIEALARSQNFGYRISFNQHTKKLEFGTFRGTDRSINQSVNPRIVFSQEYDNLLTSSYTSSDVGAVNSVYGGCKIDKDVEFTTIPSFYIGDGVSGFARSEAYVEVDEVTKDYKTTVWEYQETTTETGGTTGQNVAKTVVHTILDYNETMAKLQAECNKALVPVTENFEGEVSSDSGYKSEFDLGDIVTVFNDKLGINISQRIYEIVEVYDNEKNAVTPTFGSPAVTIMDILKNKE